MVVDSIENERVLIWADRLGSLFGVGERVGPSISDHVSACALRQRAEEEVLEVLNLERRYLLFGKPDDDQLLIGSDSPYQVTIFDLEVKFSVLTGYKS